MKESKESFALREFCCLECWKEALDSAKGDRDREFILSLKPIEPAFDIEKTEERHNFNLGELFDSAEDDGSTLPKKEEKMIGLDALIDKADHLPGEEVETAPAKTTQPSESLEIIRLAYILGQIEASRKETFLQRIGRKISNFFS